MTLPKDYFKLVPDYENIIIQCKLLMLNNFRSKGNSWLECDYLYLYDKIKEKLIPSVTEDDLLDIINLCCMIYQKRRLDPI